MPQTEDERRKSIELIRELERKQSERERERRERRSRADRERRKDEGKQSAK